LEKNLWILGNGYDGLSSDESLKRQVEQYLGQEVKYLSYWQVVSNARRSLEWLLADMQKA
jgi:hypothetical protein